MRNSLLIARREFYAYTSTLIGWVILAVALFMAAVCFNLLAVPGVAKKSAQVLADYFFWTGGWTMAACVFLSMRLIAEERTNHTLPLLYSSPVRDVEIVLGKYLSAMAFMAVFLATTLFMPALVFAYGKVSMGHILCGYIGLLLVASVTIASGVLASALAPNQLVSLLFGALFAILLTIVWWLAHVTESPLSDVFNEMSWYGHFRPFSEGVLHLKHVLYFALFTYFGLFASTRVLEARRWR